MRAALLLTAALLLPGPAVGQPLTKQECAVAAADEEQHTELLRKAIRVEELYSAGEAKARQRSLGAVAGPLDTAASARLQYLDAARSYLKASEDLAYQLRVCAR